MPSFCINTLFTNLMFEAMLTLLRAHASDRRNSSTENKNNNNCAILEWQCFSTEKHCHENKNSDK